jgi:hypothetical protein
VGGFGVVSNKFEIASKRYGGDCMHEAILGVLASLICITQWHAQRGYMGVAW